MKCRSRGQMKSEYRRRYRSDSREEETPRRNHRGLAAWTDRTGTKRMGTRLWSAENDQEVKTARARRTAVGSATKKTTASGLNVALMERSCRKIARNGLGARSKVPAHPFSIESNPKMLRSKVHAERIEKPDFRDPELAH